MKFILCVVCMFLLPVGSVANELRILTSFPSNMTRVFEELWAEKHPHTDLQILNKNTISAVEEIQRGNTRGFDLFWASSPEAFVLLGKGDHFVDATYCGADGPATVTEFAISSVGWARRDDSRLFMPGKWNDLLLPLYREQIAMARPARSGTTHLLVEQLLQVRGWEEGWAYFLQLAGNLSTLTARSHGVPDGLLRGRFKIGLMIDFLATSRADELRFQYGRPVMNFSARIGILAGGTNTKAACDFVALLLSRDGQLALTDPDVSRTPIDPQVRAQVGAAIPKEITTDLQLPWLQYSAEVSADRYWAVNALFDLMITDVLDERRELWHRYSALEDIAPAEDLARIKRLLTTVPVTERQAVEVSEHAGTGLRPTVQAVGSNVERDAIEQWREMSAALLSEAAEELARIEQMVAE